jgi:hypothetical protein
MCYEHRWNSDLKGVSSAAESYGQQEEREIF